MTQNILCMSLCQLNPNSPREYNRNLTAQQSYLIYEAMCELVIHSAETFIQEEFDIVILEDQVNNYQEIFHKSFGKVYHEWQQGANILYLDCDTLVAKPTEVFGKFDEFRLFNYTDPKVLSGKDAKNKYGISHPHYFNAGVRYYPHNMRQDIWDLGWKYANDWDFNIWGTEQIIFNTMMFAQDELRPRTKWLLPEMNYQVLLPDPKSLDIPADVNICNRWNGIDINDASIMHLHGTRSAPHSLLTQWEIWRRATGEEFEFTKFRVDADKHQLIQK